MIAIIAGRSFALATVAYASELFGFLEGQPIHYIIIILVCAALLFAGFYRRIFPVMYPDGKEPFPAQSVGHRAA